jgi:glycerol-3-phosphate dehydrogenase
VTRRRLQRALDERGDSSLDDLRRTTRLGMGPCQGAFCTPRAAAVLDAGRPGAANPLLRGFLGERLRGTLPVAWGDQLAELWLAAGIFRGTLAADGLADAPEIPTHAAS